MKLTNEQKRINSTICTGMGILKAHMVRQEVINDNLLKEKELVSKIDTELGKAKTLVISHDIKMREFFKEQTNTCIELLNTLKVGL